MFLPSEAVFAELHASFGDVVEQSKRDRVFIVSPTTLWATLNTVRAVFRDVRMREQAGEIQEQVGILMKDVSRLDDRVGKLHRHFEQAQKDVGEIQKSTGKIIRRAEIIGGIEVEEIEAEAAEIAEVTVLAPPERRLSDGS